MESLKSIALLIDADNAPLSKIEDLLREISAYGRISLKRAYANWRKDELKNWEAELKRLAIKAEQQFDYVSGKNATDIALVIDAVNLLHTQRYDGFVIVSSDSDYTPLAISLRESNVFVIGAGERKTPESFRNSCDVFVYMENLGRAAKGPVTAARADAGLANASAASGAHAGAGTSSSAGAGSSADGNDAAGRPSAGQESSEWCGCSSGAGIDEIHCLLRIAWDKYQDDAGFADISSVGAYIKRAKPDFSAKDYGFDKLPGLVAAFPDRYEMATYPGKGTVTIRGYRCIG